MSLLLPTCGGDAPAAPDGATTLVFRIRNLPASEEFRHVTSSPDLIATARQQVGLPVAQRSLLAAGPIAKGNGGHDQP